MNLQIYKPNSKNTGCAISFQISQKENQEPQFYVNCIAQHSWDINKKTGSFAESRNDPSKTIAIKFNEFELGEIINAFNTKNTYSSYHSNDSNKTQIKISSYEKTKGIGEFAVTYTAFGLSIVRNGSDSFKVPLEPGEAVRITAFINKFYSLLDDSRKLAPKSESKPQFTKKLPNVEPVSTPASKAPKNQEEDDF